MLTRTKRALLLSTLSAALGAGLWWATGGNTLLASFAPAYTLWWCISVPPYYRALSTSGMTPSRGPRTPPGSTLWITKISWGLLLAIPALGAGLSTALYILIYLWPWSPPGLAQMVLSTLLTALPFSTLTAIAYIGYELHDISNSPAARKPTTNLPQK